MTFHARIPFFAVVLLYRHLRRCAPHSKGRNSAYGVSSTTSSPLHKQQQDWVCPPKQSHKAELKRVFGQFIVNNLPSTVVLHNTHDFFHPRVNTVRKSIACITARFAPANDCIVRSYKISTVAFLSGTVWVDISSPIFIFGAVNRNL